MASSQLRIAKLERPRLFGATARSRVFHLLQGATERSVVWITAPPGAGKTTAVASFLDTHRRGGIWYQVDAGDADPAAFFYYLSLATRASRRGSDPALPLFTPEFLADLPGFARRFFQRLFGRWRDGDVLVLDNFQDAGSGDAFHAIVAEAMESVPAGCAVIVVSRELPPESYGRPMASDRAVLLDWSHLALTPEETAEIARSRAGIDAISAAMLHERCSGWAAGLTLLLETFRKGATDEDAFDATNLQGVFDFFASQVFTKADREQQELLLQLGLLPRISGPIAEALTGSDAAVRLLEQLYRRHLFTHRRRAASGAGTGRHTYSFHALFRAFLRHRAGESWSPAALVAALTRAANLMELSDAPEDAFDLYVEAGAWTDAARVLNATGGALLAAGRWRTVLDWVNRLPLDSNSGDASLLLWRGMATMASDPAAARTSLEPAFHAAKLGGQPLLAVIAAAAVIDTYILEYKRFFDIDAWIAEVADVIADDGFRFPNVDTELRVCCSALNAMTFRVPAHPYRAQCVERVFGLATRSSDPNVTVSALGALVLHSGLTGRIPMGRRAVPMLLAAARHPDVTPHVLAVALYALAYYYTLDVQDDVARARLQIARLRGIAADHGLPHVAAFADLVDFCHALRTGNAAEATRWAQVMERNAIPGRPFEAGAGPHAHSWIAVSVGDAATAVARTREVEPHWTATGCVYWEHIWDTPLIWGGYELGDTVEARRRFEAFAASAATTDMPVLLMSRDLMAAKFALDAGDRETARRHVISLIDCASREGPTYLDSLGHWFEQIMSFALQEQLDTVRVTRLIRLLADRPVDRSRIDETLWPWRLRIRAFGPLTVLRDDVPVDHGRKSPRKVLALLGMLVAFGPAPVALGRLGELLWPGDDTERCASALRVTIHRLRDMLDDPAAVRVDDGSAWLDEDLVWVDAYAFERCHASAADGDPALVARALSLYTGPFLSTDHDASWALSRRERLRGRLESLVLSAAGRLEGAERWQEALDLYETALQREDLIESLHRGRMACLAALGREAEAIAAFVRLRQQLWLRYAMPPSTKTTELADAIRAGSLPGS